MSTGMIWQTRSTEQSATERLGELFGRHLKLPALLELRADLGGGKTTFVRGLARGLGSKDIVSSPTFTLSKEYNAKDATIKHLDFYRLNEPGVLRDQLQESLNDDKAVTVIEWSDIVKDALPKARISIEFKPTVGDADEREITVRYSENFEEVIKAVQTDWQEVQP